MAVCFALKTAIRNERIKAVSPTEVAFTPRANKAGGKRRITLTTPEFIRRLLLHVLPGGIKRIRHYGVLAKGCKKTQLAQARQALLQPAQNPQATESARDVMARVAGINVNSSAVASAATYDRQEAETVRRDPTRALSQHGLQAVWGKLAPKPVHPSARPAVRPRHPRK